MALMKNCKASYYTMKSFARGLSFNSNLLTVTKSTYLFGSWFMIFNSEKSRILSILELIGKFRMDKI